MRTLRSSADPDPVTCSVRSLLDAARDRHAAHGPEDIQGEHGGEARQEALDRREMCVLLLSKNGLNRRNPPFSSFR